MEATDTLQSEVLPHLVRGRGVHIRSSLQDPITKTVDQRRRASPQLLIRLKSFAEITRCARQSFQHHGLVLGVVRKPRSARKAV